jgi:hypothetical protein
MNILGGIPPITSRRVSPTNTGSPASPAGSPHHVPSSARDLRFLSSRSWNAHAHGVSPSFFAHLYLSCQEFVTEASQMEVHAE